jgi:hypothetical protein
MQSRRFECSDRSHSATPRYQPPARYGTNKKSRDNQACILGQYGHSKFFVFFVPFVVNFTSFYNG